MDNRSHINSTLRGKEVSFLKVPPGAFVSHPGGKRTGSVQDVDRKLRNLIICLLEAGTVISEGN